MAAALVGSLGLLAIETTFGVSHTFDVAALLLVALPFERQALLEKVAKMIAESSRRRKTCDGSP
jgi:hypothetical protein